MIRSWTRICLLVWFCTNLFLTGRAAAQTGTATIRGEISDAQGRVVAGATVTLKNPSVGFSRAQTTGAAGGYSFELISPGEYTLEVEAKGFKKVVRNVTALVGSVETADLRLEIGSIDQVVQVEAGASAITVDTEDATLGNSFENQQITQLPLESRNVLSLLTLQPGVTKDGYVAGARSDQSNITLDGVDINDAQTTSVGNNRDNPTVSATLAGPVSGPVLRLNAEAIEEFRVSTVTADAAAGHSSGAQIDLITKSGTNNFHGSLFESHRNTIFTANDFFNNKNGIERPKLIRNLFSGGLGGPVIKDRLFFFYNYEGRRDASSRPTDPTTIPRVPLATLGQGLVRFPNGGSQGGIITLTPTDIKNIFPDTGGENPVAVQALAAAAAKYPANDFTVGDSTKTLLNVAGFRFNAPAPVQLNSHVAKVDWNITSKQTMFVRANVIYDHDSSEGLPFFPDTAPQSIWLHPWGLTAGHTWTIHNNLVNNFRFGMTRQAFSQLGDRDANHVWFRFVFDPTSNTKTQTRVTPVNNFVDNLSWIKGKHTIQFGTSISLISNSRSSLLNSFDSATTNPSFYQTNLIRNAVKNYLAADPARFGPGAAIGGGAGSAVENAISALLGRYTQYTGAVVYRHDGSLQPVGAPSVRKFKTQGYEGYAQDVWKINSSLTLTAGLRYSLWRPVYETQGFEVQPDIPLSTFFQRRIAGAESGQPYNTPISVNLSGPVNGGPPLYNWDKTNFLPKVALAWSPRFDHGGLLGNIFGGKGQSVIRGGFGIAGDYFGEQLAASFDLNNTLGFSSSTTISANTYNVGCGPYVVQNNCKANLGPLFTGFNENVRALPGIPPALPLTFPQMKPSDGSPRIESSLDSQLQTPKEYIWSLTFERELPAHLLLQASYIGRLGKHLLATRDVMNPVNLTDPKSKMDWYTAATMLEKLRQAGTPCTNKDCSKIPTIPYFENLFPALAAQEGFTTTGYTPTATQTLYATEVLPNGNDWTTTQLDIDTFSPLAPHIFYQPQYGALAVFSTIGNSYYHGLAVSLRQRLHDVTFDLNYTYSHSTDDASGLQTSGTYGAALILNPFRQHDSYGNSDFDVRHQINFNSIVQLPFGRGHLLGGSSGKVLNAFIGGWQLTNIFRWNTGLPVGFYGDSGVFDDARWATNWEVQSNVTRTRPVQTCPTRSPVPKLFGCNTTVAYQSFRNAYPGETGERNVFRVPGYVNLDAGLSKSFTMPYNERHQLQLRWEIFNVTNTQKMGQYNASRSGFGVVSDPSTQLPPTEWSNFTGIQGTPRVMQIALRYSF
jgi:hypothetical protein